MTTVPPRKGRAFSNGAEHDTPVDNIATLGRFVREARDAANAACKAAEGTYETQIEMKTAWDALRADMSEFIAEAKKREPFPRTDARVLSVCAIVITLLFAWDKLQQSEHREQSGAKHHHARQNDDPSRHATPFAFAYRGDGEERNPAPVHSRDELASHD